MKKLRNKNIHNEQTLRIPGKIRQIAALIAIGVGSAQAQEALKAPTQNETTDHQVVELDSIVVLGSSRKDATVLNSSAPVDVITPQQLKETGATTINQALAKLHPSFNFPQGQNAVKGQGVRSASLRGVSPAYTLVLVNGKRRNASAQLTGTDPWPAATVVDLNVIPVSAVERVEVLRDGAAAQYGSDAIAGVVNIVLKEAASGGEIALHGGKYTDGGGNTSVLTAWKGFELGKDGFLNLSFDHLRNGNVDRSEGDWRQRYPNGDSRNTTTDSKWGQWGQSQRHNWSVLSNAEVALNDKIHAYGWANYADKSASNYVNLERVAKAVTNTASVTDGTRISENSVLSIYPNGYQPWMKYVAKDLAVVSGLRFEDEQVGKLDVGLSYGENETGRYAYGTVNPSYGAASPTSFYLGSWKSATTSLTADYVKSIPVSFLAEPLSLSAGLLARREEWRTADLGDAAGYTGGPLAGRTVGSLYPGTTYASDTTRIPVSGPSTSGIKPQDAFSISRNVKGGYTGVDAKPVKQWLIGATTRYEDYSDFGGTSNYKLTSRYDFTPAVALRGTVSSGFHAPSLAALGTQSTGTTSNWSNSGSGALTPGQTRQFRPNDTAAAAFGAKPLDPEKSRTLSLGTVIRPDGTSSITIDAYHLRVRDVITTTDTLQGTTVTTAFNNAGLTGFTQASYYTNGWDSTTKGVDVVGRKQFDVQGGKLNVSAAFSWINTKVSNVHRYVTIGGAQVLAINNARIRDAETGTPKNKVVLSSRYATGAWTYDATFTRYGKYRYNVGDVAGVTAANGNVDQEFAPEYYLDLGVAYDLNKTWRFDFSVQNVFNKYPEKYVQGNRASGINPYSFIAPNGASGRYISAGFTYSL